MVDEAEIWHTVVINDVEIDNGIEIWMNCRIQSNLPTSSFGRQCKHLHTNILAKQWLRVLKFDM